MPNNERPPYWLPVKHSMLRRNRNNNYHIGHKAYMITLHIENMVPLLSTVEMADTFCDATSRITENNGANTNHANTNHATTNHATTNHATTSHANTSHANTGHATTSHANTSHANTGHATASHTNTGSIATCRLTTLGVAMRQAWLTLPQRFKNISIIDSPCEYVIMPEHFHGIIYVTGYMQEHLSEIVRLFKARVAMAYRRLLMKGSITAVGTAKEWLKTYQELPDTQQEAARQWVENQLAVLYSATGSREQMPPPFKVVATGSHNKQGFLFATGYVDSLMLDIDNLEGHRLYISNNPHSRWMRSNNRSRLKVNRTGIDTGVTISALEGYLKRECPPRDVVEDKLDAVRGLLLCSATSRRIECQSYGDRELLQRHLLPVVCHRHDLPHFTEQKAQCLKAAANGSVMVSAAISAKEREIIEAVMEAGYPVVRIIDNGFPELYHPSQKYIDLCSINRALLITPWLYHYRHKDDAIYVAYCKTMNCIAQAICRTKDNWWQA